MKSQQRDRTGERSGRLTVISVSGISKDGHVLWLCQCDCGNSAVVASQNINRANNTGTKSCGCLRRETAQRVRAERGSWNTGKVYPIADGEHVYSQRHSWAKAVIRHYGNRCEICGWDKARCDAHHRDHRKDGGPSTIANGMVLCPNCHRIQHEGRKA